MTDDEKPKRTKSWREIDKARDGGSSSRRADTRERENFEKSTGYTKYKTNLERLFSGGAPLPEHLREKVGGEADPVADDERKKLVAIEDTKLFHVAAKEFLSKYALPDDPRLLDRLLGHPDDTIMEQALTRLEELQKAGALKAPPALSQRLASVAIDSGDPAVRKRATELRKVLPKW
ncbi:MAG TPA: hypothetical protein VH083_02100 [Myxococcales bacterium]|nr:hypothetical protein [Myxococcales bacterium]